MKHVRLNCHFCDKAFMNQAFLQSHIQRRHTAESHLEYNTKAQTDRLQKEVDMLKEQLQLTRSQLESAQYAHAVRFSKEQEMQKTKEDDFLKLFDRWKEEEEEKLLDEMEKVKEMFMKEFKELTSKNSALEYQLLEIQKSSMQIKSNIGTLRDVSELKEDHSAHPQDLQNTLQLISSQESKRSDQLQVLNEKHNKEKGQIPSHVDKLRSSLVKELKAENVFYKRWVEELDQKVQEQSEFILSQKRQIREFTSKPYSSVSELKGNPLTWQAVDSKPAGPAAPMGAPATQTLDGASSLAMVHENTTENPTSCQSHKAQQAFSSHVLEPIEELSSEEEKGRENEQKLNKKTHFRKTLRSNPSSKRLRTNLEKELGKKLRSFGIDADIHGIPCEILNKSLKAMQLARHDLAKQMPDIQQIRESLEQQLICKIEEKVSLFSDRHNDPAVTAAPAEEVPRVTQFPPQSRPLATQRAVFADKMAAPKLKKNTKENHFIRKFSATKTPPFSSEEDLGEEDIIEAYVSPDLMMVQPSKNSLGNFRKSSARSDTDWTEGNEMEGSNVSPKPSGTSIKIQTEDVGSMVVHQGSGNKPVTGTNPAETLAKKEEVQELKCADEDNWDISSLEEEKSVEKKMEQREPPPVKRDLSSSQVPRAWGPVNPREFKEEGRQENDSSAMRSSLITVTDWSDVLDM